MGIRESVPAKGFVIPEGMIGLTNIERDLLEMSRKPGHTTQKVSWRNIARLRMYQRDDDSFDSLLGRALNIVEWFKAVENNKYKKKHGHYPEKVGVVRYTVWEEIKEWGR